MLLIPFWLDAKLHFAALYLYVGHDNKVVHDFICIYNCYLAL